MSVAVAEKNTITIPAPELRGASLALGSCRDTEVGLDGPAGTGKTFGALYYIHVLLLTYPGSKWLVTRRYNTDLAGSAMATYQQDVLDPREGVYYFGGNKVRPPGFVYPNGSFMAVNGLDRPSRLKSFEADGIYINEATECEIEHLEYARMRLRKGTMPWQQILMDFNPGAPTHWLNQRMNAGVTTRLLSRHEDNPRYWDAIKREWTEAGRRYMAILDGLTGVRLLRYRYGQWAAAEGTIYQDSWDAARNLIDKAVIPPEWPRFLAIDFGFSHPFCCLWAAIDPDGRIVVYRQIYRTHKLVEEHARDIAAASGWFHLLPTDHPLYAEHPADNADPLPIEIICDHDAEGRATLETHLNLYTMPAYKPVKEGIQAVAARFRLAGDGQPRLKIMRSSLVERDEDLVSAKKPTCIEEEPDCYVWKKDSSGATDEPVKEYDHGLDPLRYLVARFDLKPNDVSSYPGIWN